MQDLRTRRSFLRLGGAVLLLPAAACAVKQTGPAAPHPQGNPPPQAPAHGLRAKRTYHYYPDACVYFDIDRKLYFHLDGGVWKAAATLPGGITLAAGTAVTLEMETDTPYAEFESHKAKYPPGLAKKDGVPPGQQKDDESPGKGKGKDKKK